LPRHNKGFEAVFLEAVDEALKSMLGECGRNWSITSFKTLVELEGKNSGKPGGFR
jgi:hypothetical protein